MEKNKEKNNNISQKPTAANETDKVSTKQKGLIERFFAWIAKGAEKASKAGELCGK